MSDQRPTTAELVTAVREFMELEVLAQLDGSTGFHARVAINVLKIVERELAEGAALGAAEYQRLAELLGVDDADQPSLDEHLLAGIRSGELGLDTPGLADHLRATVMGRLGIDNPRYGSYRKALEGVAAPD